VGFAAGNGLAAMVDSVSVAASVHAANRPIELPVARWAAPTSAENRMTCASSGERLHGRVVPVGRAWPCHGSKPIAARSQVTCTTGPRRGQSSRDAGSRSPACSQQRLRPAARRCTGRPPAVPPVGTFPWPRTPGSALFVSVNPGSSPTGTCSPSARADPWEPYDRETVTYGSTRAGGEIPPGYSPVFPVGGA
jgi:hypothetical protein